MKPIFRRTWYLIAALPLATVLLFVLTNAGRVTQAAFAPNLPVIGMPAVTVRFVETRTADLIAPATDTGTVPAAPKVEIPVDIPPAMNFVLPEVPVVEKPAIENLVANDKEPFNLQPVNERPTRTTLIH